MKALAVYGVLAASSVLASDIYLVEITQSPDFVKQASTEDPLVLSDVGPTLGDFVRGFDLDSPTTGWYVMTSLSTITPREIGLARWDNGSSTVVAQLPFTSISLGGLSLDETNSFLFWVSDPSGTAVDDQLWRLEFDGTATLIGNITVPGQSSVSINGIAVGPDGTLYAAENTSKKLLVLDRSNAAVISSVPLATSRSTSAAGGLDWDDATGSLLWSASSYLFRVDPATGEATEIADYAATSSAIAVVPASAPCGSPDFNEDGGVDIFDVQAFFDAFSGSGPGDPDFNRDGGVDIFDVDAFFRVFGGGAC